MSDIRFATNMGRGPRKIPHWEHWSDPDAATYITGIDYYTQPRSCMQRLNELYALDLSVPESDTPLPRREEQEDKDWGRWRDAYRVHWHWQRHELNPCPNNRARYRSWR